MSGTPAETGAPIGPLGPLGPWLLTLGVIAGAGFVIGRTLSQRRAPARRRIINRRVPLPAKPVDLHSYLGRWYELGRYENRFERGADYVTADYALADDGLISIVNACRFNGERSRRKRVRGRAKVVPVSRNTQLKVSFFGPFFIGDYWVLDHADDYSWSIVGEPRGKFLWILAREPRPPAELYASLLRRVAQLGYSPESIRPTQQG